MPRYKNEFAGPSFVQETIRKQGGGTVGVIRVKPSSVLWKPVGDHQFYCVPLERFSRWIMSRRAGASRTSS
jgi:hypothetical protein